MRSILIDIGKLIERGVVALEALATNGSGGAGGEEMGTVVNVGNCGCGEVADVQHAVVSFEAAAGTTAYTTIIAGVALKRIAILGGRMASPHAVSLALGHGDPFVAMEGDTWFPAHAYILPSTSAAYPHFVLPVGAALVGKSYNTEVNDCYVGGFLNYILID